jgi:ABC-type multidrug transport system fused ATPase/permease subunit
MTYSTADESVDEAGDGAAEAGGEEPAAAPGVALPTPSEPELETAYWRVFQQQTARTSLVSMLRRTPRILGRVLALAWRSSPWATSVVLGFEVASGVLGACGLLATQGVLVALLSGGPTPDRVRHALPALLGVCLAYLLAASFDAGVARAHAVLRPRVTRRAEDRLYTATVRVELAAYDDPAWHDHLARVRDQGTYRVPAAVDSLTELTSAVVSLVGAAGVLVVLHPLLLALLAAAVLPRGWSALRSLRLAYDSMLALSTVRRRLWMFADLLADREPAAEIRAYTARDALLVEYRRLAALAERESIRVALAQARAGVWGRGLAGVATGGIYLTLGLLLNARVMPLASAGTAVLAISSGERALTRVVLAVTTLFENGLYVEDYDRLVADAEARCYLRADAGEAPERVAAITVDNVTFAYPGKDEPVLREVSLTINRGEIVALVGENGSGKSTLAKLLAGLYLPGVGEVRWDGVSTADLDAHSLHQRVAVVMQEPTRWPLPARENIRIGRHERRDPDDAAMRAAAVAAGAAEVIERLPRGYQTLLSKAFRHGQDLSGGEWQRLSVARGLYRDAPLIVFDEPTSALDARAEARVYDTIHQRLAGPDRTIVLITHRLASVRGADRIIVLKDGRVLEQGSHAELLAARGEYAALFELQRDAYADVEVGQGD